MSPSRLALRGAVARKPKGPEPPVFAAVGAEALAPTGCSTNSPELAAAGIVTELDAVGFATALEAAAAASGVDDWANATEAKNIDKAEAHAEKAERDSDPAKRPRGWKNNVTSNLLRELYARQ
jgi:hypothetical protein